MDKKRILIVDDEPGLARLLQANLESCGRYETLVEHRAESAVTAARAFRPHVVLLDMVMPCLSGREVADQLQADPGCADVVVVFLTAAEHGASAAGHDGGPAGARWIAKPASLEVIIRCIEQSLSSGREEKGGGGEEHGGKDR